MHDMETALAFGPLEDRAAADGPAGADRISLRDHVRRIEVGAFQSERGTLQRVRFDVVVDVPAPVADDDVDSVLSYDSITGAIDGALAAGRVDLLETLAERIAHGVLSSPLARRAYVRIEKLDRGPGALGVEIVRDRGGAVGAPRAIPVPRVVLVAPGEAPDPPDGPMILVPMPDSAPPVTGDAAADRRIALLGMDIVAWRIAAGLPKLDVVPTRTEMDWVLSGGRAVIWAPSRMVLDAADPPDDVSPPALARWIAALYGAPVHEAVR